MKSISLVLITVFALSAFESDSMHGGDSLQMLQQKIEALSLEVEQLKRASVSNPISSGSYRSWGEGLYVGVEYPNLSAETGYMFKIIPQGVKLGMAAGYSLKTSSQQFDEFQDGAPHLMDGRHSVYWKIAASSPVFFNLMSFSASYSKHYVLDSYGYWDSIFTVTTPEDSAKLREELLLNEGVGATYGEYSRSQASAQTEFWITPKLSFLFGMNLYFNRFREDYRAYKIKHPDSYEYGTPTRFWVTNGFKVGARYQFGTFKGMKQNRETRRN